MEPFRELVKTNSSFYLDSTIDKLFSESKELFSESKELFL